MANKREVARVTRRSQVRLRRQQQMAEAARALLHDYQTDEELTAFLALDGDDRRMLALGWKPQC
jgi:hypothetical protein